MLLNKQYEMNKCRVNSVSSILNRDQLDAIIKLFYADTIMIKIVESSNKLQSLNLFRLKLNNQGLKIIFTEILEIY